MVYDNIAKFFVSCNVLPNDPENKHYHAGLHRILLFHTWQDLHLLQVFELLLGLGIIKVTVSFDTVLELCVQCNDLH